MIGWIFKRVTRRVRPRKPARSHYLSHKEAARKLVHERLEHFNLHYQLPYNRVAIKNMVTKWGSCSSKRNLNFSYRIIMLRPELQNYLIVHELCHLKEMNHGQGFWDLVGETIPEYKSLNRLLRQGSIDDLK